MIICIEGGDKTGKSTQAELLTSTLKSKKLDVLQFDFPSWETHAGNLIIQHLEGDISLDRHALALLFAAERRERQEEMVQQIAHRKHLVLCRYKNSNLVYGKIRGLNEEWLRNLDIGMPIPHCNILLDMNYQKALNRAGVYDVMEDDESFMADVFEEYRLMARQRCWDVVNADQPIVDVHKDIMKIVEPHIK